MKTAVLLSGQARGFKHIAGNLKENLLPNFGDVDLYFYIQDPSPYKIEDHIEPSSILYQKDISHDVSHIGNYPYGNKEQFLQQWYSLYKCKEMMLLTRKHYDLIIRTRPDNDFISPFLLESIDQKSINACSWGGHGGLNDRLAVGPYKEMLIYCDYYFHCHKYDGNSESKLESYLKDNQVQVNLIDYLFYRVNEDGARREHP